MRENNRRRSGRVPLIVDLFYRIERPPELKIKFGDHVETAYLVDISTTGIGFICGTDLPGNSELDITFNLSAPSGEVVKVRVFGVVRYCSFQEDRQISRRLYRCCPKNNPISETQYQGFVPGNKRLTWSWQARLR